MRKRCGITHPHKLVLVQDTTHDLAWVQHSGWHWECPECARTYPMWVWDGTRSILPDNHRTRTLFAPTVFDL